MCYQFRSGGIYIALPDIAAIGREQHERNRNNARDGLDVVFAMIGTAKLEKARYPSHTSP